MKIKVEQLNNKNQVEVIGDDEYIAGELVVAKDTSVVSEAPKGKVEVEVDQYDAAEALETPTYTIVANKGLLDSRHSDKLTGTPEIAVLPEPLFNPEYDWELDSRELVNIDAISAVAADPIKSMKQHDAYYRKHAAEHFLMQYEAFGHEDVYISLNDQGFGTAGLDVLAAFQATNQGAGVLDDRDAGGKANLYLQLSELHRLTERGLQYLPPFDGTETQLKAQSLVDAPQFSVQSMSDWNLVESSADIPIFYRQGDAGLPSDWVMFKNTLEELYGPGSMQNQLFIQPVAADFGAIGGQMDAVEGTVAQRYGMYQFIATERASAASAALTIIRDSQAMRRATTEGTFAGGTATVTIPLPMGDYDLDPADVASSIRVSLNGVRQSRGYLADKTILATPDFENGVYIIDLQLFNDVEDGTKLHVDAIFKPGLVGTLDELVEELEQGLAAVDGDLQEVSIIAEGF
jgi:hypothetical protein